MSYDYAERKLVAVLASSLEVGQALNVLGHLAIAIGVNADGHLLGRPRLLDGSGVAHLGIARYPLIVTKTKLTRLSRLIREARRCSDLLMADYPEQMLSTGHDDELAESLACVKEDQLRYLGALFYGKAELVTQWTGKFSLWR